MNQRNATYKAQNKGGKDNFSARYVAEYLAVPKICVNTHTHTHTHTHTFSPPIPRALIYTFSGKQPTPANLFSGNLSPLHALVSLIT